MSVRLWPDIFVAMETLAQIYARVNDEGILTEEDKENIFVDIKDCIKLQQRVNYSPFLNIFTSPEGSCKNWDEEDYKTYLKGLSYFSQEGNTSRYKLDAKRLLKGIDNFTNKEIVSGRLYAFLQNSYSGRILAATGVCADPKYRIEM